jgi:hypothetical protein
VDSRKTAPCTKSRRGCKIALRHRGGFQLLPLHHLRAGVLGHFPRPASFSRQIETSVTFLWYAVFAGNGLRSNGVDDLPPSTSGCSILPIARFLWAGGFWLTPTPGPRSRAMKKPRPL